MRNDSKRAAVLLLFRRLQGSEWKREDYSTSCFAVCRAVSGRGRITVPRKVVRVLRKGDRELAR